VQPLVSALVPTYNGAAFIQRTLDSLAAQTWPRLEVVIADDCSTDETLAVVRRFAADHDDVVVVERTSNLGWLRNTNDLMSRASGELMFFAFHDDVVDPDYVEKLAGALLDRPSAVLAFSDLELVDVKGHRTIRRFTDLESRSTTLERGFAMAHRPDNWWVPNRGLFRAEAYRRVGGIHPNQAGEYSADWPWLLHLALLGDLVRVPEVLCHKYYKPGSLSKQWPHDLRQLEALKRAGRDEVWMSSIPWAHKVVLTTYMRDLPLVPRPIRRAARLLSTRLLRRSSVR
jgi:glycosyltransferase involved in cell wall biosynthesis